MDTRANRNLDKLNSELQDVQRIMTQNIQDVLGRGEKLESMDGHPDAALVVAGIMYLHSTPIWLSYNWLGHSCRCCNEALLL
jgi:hypothetical protein